MSDTLDPALAYTLVCSPSDQDIGPVCLFIASKDAEKAMRMSTVANVTVRKKRKRDSRTNEEPNVDSKDPVRSTETFGDYSI